MLVVTEQHCVPSMQRWAVMFGTWLAICAYIGHIEKLYGSVVENVLELGMAPYCNRKGW